MYLFVFFGNFMVLRLTALHFIMYQNHQNIGPVILLFDSRFIRRLKQTSSGDHGRDIRRVQEMITSGEYEEHARRLREEEEQSGRALQEANPDILVELVVTWQGCLFEVSFDMNVACNPLLFLVMEILTFVCSFIYQFVGQQGCSLGWSSRSSWYHHDSVR